MALGILLSANDIAVIKIADVPAKALYVTQPLNETNRLFVLNQKGMIHIIENGITLKTPFLNISSFPFASKRVAT